MPSLRWPLRCILRSWARFWKRFTEGVGNTYTLGAGGSSNSLMMLDYTKGSELKKEAWWELYKEKIKRTAVKIESVAEGPFRGATSFLPRNEPPTVPAAAAVVDSTPDADEVAAGGASTFNDDIDKAGAVLAAIQNIPKEDESLPPVDDDRFKWYRQIREYEPPNVENFPPIPRRWAVEVARNTGCDIGYAAVAAISALSGAAVGGVWVDGGTGFRVPLAVWNAMIGESGCGKSLAHSHVRSLFNPLEKESRKRHSKAMEKYEKDMERWETIKKEWEECGGKPPPKPKKPQYVNFTVDDSTPEALVMAMEANPRGVFGVHDELSGWLGMGRYGKSGVDGERAFHLSSYDGGEAKVNRVKGDIPIRVESACAARFGGIQPGPMIRSSKKLDAVESGLLPRFGLVWPPDHHSYLYQLGHSVEQRELLFRFPTNNTP